MIPCIFLVFQEPSPIASVQLFNLDVRQGVVEPISVVMLVGILFVYIDP